LSQDRWTRPEISVRLARPRSPPSAAASRHVDAQPDGEEASTRRRGLSCTSGGPITSSCWERGRPCRPRPRTDRLAVARRSASSPGGSVS
jgi:hypothetical protein